MYWPVTHAHTGVRQEDPWRCMKNSQRCIIWGCGIRFAYDKRPKILRNTPGRPKAGAAVCNLYHADGSNVKCQSMSSMILTTGCCVWPSLHTKYGLGRWKMMRFKTMLGHTEKWHLEAMRGIKTWTVARSRWSVQSEASILLVTFWVIWMNSLDSLPQSFHLLWNDSHFAGTWELAFHKFWLSPNRWDSVTCP